MKSLIEQGKLLSLSAGRRASNRLPDLVEIRGRAISWQNLGAPVDFVLPTIFSAVLAILTGWAAWLVNAAKI